VVREKSGKMNYYNYSVAESIVQTEICNDGVLYLIRLFIRCCLKKNCISYMQVELWHLLTYDFLENVVIIDMSVYMSVAERNKCIFYTATVARGDTPSMFP